VEYRVFSIVGVFVEKGQLLKAHPAKAAIERPQILDLVQVEEVVMNCLEEK
jgi:hypothetical protein